MRRKTRWLSGAVWVFSWYTVYREIFVWHHMTPTLRFKAPDAPPGVEPHPGLPVRAIRVAALASPVVFAATWVRHGRGVR